MVLHVKFCFISIFSPFCFQTLFHQMRWLYRITASNTASDDITN